MLATNNIPLNVPFKEKDEAKSHGARWNPGAKHWYIPEGVEEEPFAKWRDGAPDQHAAPSEQPNPSNTTLSTNTDFDDINAMLRDAYEGDND